MRNNLLTKFTFIFSIVSFIIITRIASAAPHDLKFYAGTGFDYIRYSSNDANIKSINAPGFWVPILGVKFCDAVGLEFGYGFNSSVKEKSPVKANNAYLDMIGFIPVLDGVDAVVGVGIGKFIVKKKADILDEFENKFSWRAKFGAQYNINDNLGLRALLIYQNLKNKVKTNTEEIKPFKNMKSLGLSVIWTF